MTEIESFLYERIVQCEAVLVGKLDFRDGVLSVSFVAEPGGTALSVLKFTDARITSIWVDEKDTIEWPLELIGFDCYAANPDWRFVLNCSCIEFCWTSGWPSKL